MGRAKSNTKRRPKGKRGWRKIDAPSILNPTIRLSIEEQKLKISQSRDSQLWSEDTKPRPSKKKLTKKQLKQSAKHKLLYRGFKINSTNAHRILTNQIKSFNKKQRFFQWKQSQTPVNPNPPKQSTMLKFKNKTKKKIKLKNHKHITTNKKNIGNIDVHKNNPYNLYKMKHKSTNNKHQKQKDLWDTTHKKSDHSSKTFNPIPMIKHQKQASKMHMNSGRSAPNKFVLYSNVISLPKPGDSINPLKHQYYYSKWKALELKAKQIFEQHYQKKSTEKWYKKTHEETDEHVDNVIQKLKNQANEMKMLHLKHLRLLKTGQRNGYVKNNDGNDRFEREISDLDKMKDVESNQKLKLVKRQMRLASRMGHRIYGTKYRFKQRVTKNQKEYKIGNCLRSTLHSGTDHPLSFMFNEMQKQNKIPGHRRHRFIFPKKKAFLGPRFKVQTRIGKLHHANVGKKIWDGVDD